MFRTRDQHNRDQRFSSVPEPSSGDDGNGQYYLDPILDDGRRGLSTASPPGSPASGDRYIVGVNGSGLWSSLRGELVSWDGAAWTATTNPVGAQTYCKKRVESLSLLSTDNKNISPALSPEYVVATGTPVINFWLPNSLVDSFYSNWKGAVVSVTTDSASWATNIYNRYVVQSGDTNYNTYAKYIATYVVDLLTHTGRWIFQPAREGDLLYSTGDNNFYYFDGTNWVVMTSGNTAFYGAEGRPGADGLGSTVLTAAVVNTYQKIPFELSAITNLTFCPPSMFADGEDTITIPRYGIYAVGFHGFRVTYDGPEPDSITFCVKINGTVVENSVLPVLDDYEGDSYHGIFELDLNDEITFEFKTTGAGFDTEITIVNGFSAYAYTVDAKGGTGPVGPHALNEHTDTNFPSPSDGDVIKWDSGTGRWINGTVSAIASPHNIISVSHGDTALTGSLTNGQMLKRVGGVWTNANLPTFEELYDTTFTSLTTGDIAQWNGSAWVNIPSTSISGVHTLDSHSNVNTSGKITGSNLRWNGSAWVVYTPTFAGLSDVTITSPAIGQVPVWNGSAWVNGTVSATTAFKGGNYVGTGGSGWSVLGPEIGCTTSGLNFVALVDGYWEAIVTFAPTGVVTPPLFQWYSPGGAAGSPFGATVNQAYMTFANIFGLAAGQGMRIIDTAGSYRAERATFKKVGG